VTILYWLALVCLGVGVVIRVATSRRYLDAYARKYGSAPSRGWLWTADRDPEVERLRRIMAVGTSFLIVSGIAFVISMVTR
jgi:hypothetical protein